jgi:hypothetical protein
LSGVGMMGTFHSLTILSINARIEASFHFLFL